MRISDGAFWQTEGMVTLLLDSMHLEVALSGTERAMSFQRENVRVDRSMITKVQLTDDLWTWLRGVNNPGILIRGTIAAGVWQSVAGADFVMVRGRKKSGVVIDLTHEAPFQRLVLSTKHGLALVKALRLEVAEELNDVVTLTSPIPTIKQRPSTRPATA